MCELCGPVVIACQPSACSSSRQRTACTRARVALAILVERWRPCGRAAGLSPASASSAGRAKSRNVTSEDTGLPGSPKTSVAPRVPNDVGLPGLAARRRRSAASTPRPSERFARRGRGDPTDMPPVITSRPPSSARGDRRADQRRIVARVRHRHRLAAGALDERGDHVGARVAHRARHAAARPRRPARHRSSRRRRADAGRQRRSRSPPTRARRARPARFARPARARARRRARRRRRGARRGRARRATSSSTAPSRRRVSSTRTTASAPAGIAAPVEIAQASPAPTVTPAGAPARDSSTTRSSTPAPLSAARTAKPSIAELSNGGTSPGARTSSASTRPSASASVDRLGRKRRRAVEHAANVPPRTRSASLPPDGNSSARGAHPDGPAVEPRCDTAGRVEESRRARAPNPRSRSAPTALEVLKEAVARARRDHRRGPPRGVGGVGPAGGRGVRRLDLLRRPAGAAGPSPRARVHRHRVLRGHRRRACRRAARGARPRARRAPRRRLGIARRDRLPRLLPFLARDPRRRPDRRGRCRRRARARRGDARRERARVAQRARGAGADRAPETWSGLEHALARHTPESLLEEVKAATRPRTRRRRLPGRRQVGVRARLAGRAEVHRRQRRRGRSRAPTSTST